MRALGSISEWKCFSSVLNCITVLLACMQNMRGNISSCQFPQCNIKIYPYNWAIWLYTLCHSRSTRFWFFGSQIHCFEEDVDPKCQRVSVEELNNPFCSQAVTEWSECYGALGGFLRVNENNFFYAHPRHIVGSKVVLSQIVQVIKPRSDDLVRIDNIRIKLNPVSELVRDSLGPFFEV